MCLVRVYSTFMGETFHAKIYWGWGMEILYGEWGFEMEMMRKSALKLFIDVKNILNYKQFININLY